VVWDTLYNTSIIVLNKLLKNKIRRVKSRKERRKRERERERERERIKLNIFNLTLAYRKMINDIIKK